MANGFGAFGSRLQFETSGFVYAGKRYPYDKVHGLEFRHSTFVPRDASKALPRYESSLRVVLAGGAKVTIRPEMGLGASFKTLDKTVHDSVLNAAEWLAAYTFTTRMDQYEALFKAKKYVQWGHHQIAANGDLFYRHAHSMNLLDDKVRCILYPFHIACLRRPRTWWKKMLGLLLRRTEIIDLRRDRDCFLFFMKRHIGISWGSETLRAYRGMNADGTPVQKPKVEAAPQGNNPTPQATPQEAPRTEQANTPPPREEPRQEAPPPPPPPQAKVMPTNVQHLATLGLAPDATWEVVRSSYRQLARKHHPDLMRGKGAKDEAIQQAENTLKLINEAYGWLEDFYKLKPR